MDCSGVGKALKWSAIALAMALAPVAAGAQILPSTLSTTARHSAGGSGVYAQPLGEFGQNVKRGFGLDGAATYGVDSRGIFGLRGELGNLSYNTKREPFLANTGFGVVELESETKSNVLTLGLGPQLSVPVGPLRPYIAGTIGFARFATETAINVPARNSNTGSAETIDKQTVSSDFVRSLAATAGIAFELPMLWRGLLGNIGARYHKNGLAKYVSSEGVKYTSGSPRPTVTATESEADFVVYRLGLIFQIQ